MSKSSRNGARQSAPRPIFAFARKPWFIAYAVAVLATGAIGIVTAPTKSIPPTVSEEKAARLTHGPAEATPRRFVAAMTPVKAKFGLNWYERLAGPKDAAPMDVSLKRFTRAVEQAATPPAKSASVSPRKKTVARLAAEPVRSVLAEPAPERFAGIVTPTDPNAPVLLAYADPSPTAAGGMLDAMASGDATGGLAANGPLAQATGLPEDVPVPLARPKYSAPKADEAVAEKPAAEKPASEKPAAVEPAPEKPAKKVVAAKPQVDDSVRGMAPGEGTPQGTGTKLAYARPDDASDKGSGGGGFLSGLFRGDNPSKPSRARNGVAVYDISAAKVYMPDGSVLEAHSGIGKMADNPRYAHVKMNGPTPPQTYALKMRETRFHGVEAIRMTPVGSGPMHGRTGILAHSYLLRSRMAQSHGCVAFKDYPKFLRAFKAGKIKTMIVVPSGGRNAVQVARNGDDV